MNMMRKLVEAVDDADRGTRRCESCGGHMTREGMCASCGKVNEGYNERGKRDGTGPYKDSAQRSVSNIGRRKAAGETCPAEKDSELQIYGGEPSGEMAEEGDGLSKDELHKELLSYSEALKTMTPGSQEYEDMVDRMEDIQAEIDSDDLEEGCGKPGKKAQKAAGETYSKKKQPEKFWGTANKIQKNMDESYDAGISEMVGMDAIKAWASAPTSEGMRILPNTILIGNTRVAERSVEAKHARVLRGGLAEGTASRARDLIERALRNAGYQVELVDSFVS